MSTRFAAASMAIALSATLAACGDDGTGLDAMSLEGTWIAINYEYTDNADELRVVDIITRDHASFSLTVDANGTASTLLDDGVGGTSSDSGTLDSTQTTLTLAGSPFEAQRDDDKLRLTYGAASFDFGEGSTSATLRIVLIRP